MIPKTIPDAVKSDGSKVPQEPGLGAKLAAASVYYFDVSVPDGPTESVQVIWDSGITAVVNFQDCNAPAYKGYPRTDPDSGVDVSLFDNNGNWVTEDPSTAYLPAPTGSSVANFTLTITGGTANSTMFNIGNSGGRRGRMKVTTTLAGFLRVLPHGKGG